MYDELNELEDKIPAHRGIVTAGFVIDSEPDMRDDVTAKIRELTGMFGIEVVILSFEKWLTTQFQRAKCKPDEFARKWFNAYVESLCHRRADVAPIDEPSEVWVKELSGILRKALQ